MFLVYSYDPDTNTECQFHGCHWHEHTCNENCIDRQNMRYKDTCQVDSSTSINGWDKKYNLV